MGLPIVAEPLYAIEQESGRCIKILHPSILVLTKMKRWSHYHESSRPKTVSKNKSDQADIDFLLNWLEASDMFIEFEQYRGKSKGELLAYVRAYRKKFIANVELINTLETVVKPDDWEVLCEEEDRGDIPSQIEAL